MSANPIDKNPTPNTTGSLEELFRHHLGEEAAVPPRPMLWDQIDNSLLIRQNEIYRRRLVATRWVAAASLLLATLAGTGWWAHRAADLAGAEMATANRANGTGAGANAVGGTKVASGVPRRWSAATGQSALATGTATAKNSGSTTTNAALAQGSSVTTTGAPELRSPASHYTKFGSGSTPAIARNGAEHGGRSGGRTGSEGAITRGLGNEATVGGSAFNTRSSRPVAASTSGLATSAASTDSQALVIGSAATSATVATSGIAPAATGSAVVGTTAAVPTLAAVAPAATAGTAAESVSLLAAHPTALSLTAPANLPDGLTALSLPADAEPAVAPLSHKWSYGASYTAGAFNPNINFSRTGLGSEYAYNPALGADSPTLTESAATQYRDNLRPGLSQRIALLATRHLGGHWSLSTGAEFTQATAKSASIPAFVGEQLLEGQATAGPLQNTNFRYRMAGIPVELRYANATKRGWSLYGRLGGVVNALLGVRSEVEGNPEATRTYSFMSAGAPYRRILGSVRGGAGAQFRPGTGTWAFTLGPVVELGLVPLNAHPAQTILAQSRPYSFGVEAGVEFGR